MIPVDNRKFSPPREFSAPAEGFFLELGANSRVQKSRMVGLPDG